MGCGEGKTWPVGSRPAGASPYGALDMSGNVAELVTNADRVLTSHDATKDPDGIIGSVRSRGGSFMTMADHPRLKVWGGSSSLATDENGFRCAYTPLRR
jgi:formylglycine-generating enzyme required for sulfatase activity